MTDIKCLMIGGPADGEFMVMPSAYFPSRKRYEPVKSYIEVSNFQPMSILTPSEAESVPVVLALRNNVWKPA
jgi:hypothetical protein